MNERLFEDRLFRFENLKGQMQAYTHVLKNISASSYFRSPLINIISSLTKEIEEIKQELGLNTRSEE